VQDEPVNKLDYGNPWGLLDRLYILKLYDLDARFMKSAQGVRI